MLDTTFTHRLLEAALLPPAALLVWSFLRSWPGFVLQSVERQERLAWSRERLAALTREAMMRAAFLLLLPFATRPFSSSRSSQAWAKIVRFSCRSSRRRIAWR